ncbi:MAG: hypothetical protein AAF721_25355 [Myxococcota bacterium]
MTDSHDPGAHTRYAAGLPSVGKRSLTDSERTWLRRRLRRASFTGSAVLLGGLLSIAGAWGLGAAYPALADNLGGPAGIWLAAVGIAGCGVGLWRGGWPRIGAGLAALYLVGLAAVGALVPELTQRPHLFTKIVLVGSVGLGAVVMLALVARQLLVLLGLRRIRRDVGSGVVECFAGQAPSPTPALRALAARGFGAGSEGRPVRIEILPESGLVVRAAGRRCAPWIRVHLAEVAAAQPHALRVELPEGVAPRGGVGRMNLQRRSLSPGEQAELRNHIQRLRRRPWAAVAATIGLALAVSWQLQGELGRDAWSLARQLLDPMMLGWYALAVLTIVAYARRTIAARKLDDDRRLRWVVTVDDDRRGVEAPPKLEVLPVSQLAWTENATPASWRTSKL